MGGLYTLPPARPARRPAGAERPEEDGLNRSPTRPGPLTGLLPPGEGWFPRLLLIAVLMLTIINAVRPMASYRALSLGASPFEIGLLPAAFAALSLPVAIPVGRWIDRYRPTPFLVGGTGLMALAVLAMVFVDSVPLLIATQAALGLGHIVNIIAAQTMIANRTRPEDRDRRFGYYAVAASAGQLIGPALAGAVAGTVAGSGDRAVGAATIPVFAGGAMVGMLALVVALSLGRGVTDRGAHAGGAPAEGMLRSAATILRIPTMLPAVLVSVGVILSIDLLVAYLPVLGEERGLPVELVGLLLSIRAASSMASRLAMGYLIDRLGRRRVLWISSALAGGALALVPFLVHPAALVALMLAAGLGLGFGQPMTIAWVASRAPRPLRATALGLRLTGNRIGQLVIPAGVGLLAGVIGVAAVFWSSGGILLASAAMVARTAFDEHPRPDEASVVDGPKTNS